MTRGCGTVVLWRISRRAGGTTSAARPPHGVSPAELHASVPHEVGARAKSARADLHGDGPISTCAHRPPALGSLSVIGDTARKTERAAPPTRATRDTPRRRPPPGSGGNKWAHVCPQLTPHQEHLAGSIRSDGGAVIHLTSVHRHHERTTRDFHPLCFSMPHRPRRCVRPPLRRFSTSVTAAPLRTPGRRVKRLTFG